MSSLLFCRHLASVTITGDVERSWTLDREEVTPDHARITLKQEGTSATWHAYRHTGRVSAEAASASAGGRREYEVAVAIPEIPQSNPTGSPCVCFPTHDRLPCPLVVHATLETTDDRNRLVANASNPEVPQHLALHVAQVVADQATPATPRRALELLNGLEGADPELKKLGFVDALVRECGGRQIFPRLDGTLGTAGEVRKAPYSAWLAQADPEVFPEELPIGAEDPVRGLLSLFALSWFDKITLKQRLQRSLLRMTPGDAGALLSRLMDSNSLYADGPL